MFILELVLEAHDLAAARQFYANDLGFSVVDTPTNSLSTAKGGATVSFAVGTSILTFVQRSEFLLKPVYHFAINIPSNQIEEARAWLGSRIGEGKLLMNNVGETTHDLLHWKAHSVYAYDAGGNIIELVAREDLTHPSTHQFGLSQILCISEIGIVVEGGAKEAAANIREKYDVTTFQKSINDDEFWALGSDSGLILVKKAGTVWYPTNIVANHFPVRVTFRNRKNIEVTLETF